MIIKFKPVYKFQTAEFEIEINSEEDLSNAFSTYGVVLNYLKDVTDTIVPSEVTAAVELATEKQKEIMTKFRIPFTSSTTKEEAQMLIKNNMAKFGK